MTEVIITDDLNAPETRTPEEIKAVLDAAVVRFEETKASEESTENVPEPPVEPAVELVPHVKTFEETIELGLAEERFKKSLAQRSFSGRNPELGPMIKCAQCGLRHRDNVKHEPIKYKEGTTQSEHGRPVANAFGWRAKPGKMFWIEQLKKFVTLTR